MYKFGVFLSVRRGFSLIEVIAVIAIVTLIFGGLFVAFEYSLRLIGQSRAKMTALALSTDRIEYIRSLPYDDIGTVFGIPAGAIPQNRTVSLNGLDFAERILIEYVDDPADGVGAADSNGILSDYKSIKVEYTWQILGVTDSFVTVSNIVPRSIETSAGGGTLRVNVFDATVTPLSGISVRLLNTTTTSTIDVTRLTDSTGTAFFTGAPAAANYQIFVSGTGYSSDQTYMATTSLPNPLTLPVAVLESDVSTMNFQIDKLSAVTIQFVSDQIIGDETETFADASGIIASTSVAVVSGALQLADTAGVYAASGEAWLAPITPSPNLSWGFADFTYSASGFTDQKIQFYTSTDTADIISDTVLPGNSVGFSEATVDLRSLSTTTYSEIVPRITLSTTNTATTPTVDEVSVSYLESLTPLSGAALELASVKSIGTSASAAPIHKTSISTTTRSDGTLSLPPLEWGEYYFPELNGLIIAEICQSSPIVVVPDTPLSVKILTAPYSAHNLRVVVKTGSGETIYGATVELTRGATTVATTGWCGQAFIPSLVNASNYILEVSAPGYTSATIDPFTVTGTTTQEIILVP